MFVKYRGENDLVCKRIIISGNRWRCSEPGSFINWFVQLRQLELENVGIGRHNIFKIGGACYVNLVVIAPFVRIPDLLLMA